MHDVAWLCIKARLKRGLEGVEHLPPFHGYGMKSPNGGLGRDPMKEGCEMGQRNSHQLKQACQLTHVGEVVTRKQRSTTRRKHLQPVVLDPFRLSGWTSNSCTRRHLNSGHSYHPMCKHNWLLRPFRKGWTWSLPSHVLTVSTHLSGESVYNQKLPYEHDITWAYNSARHSAELYASLHALQA